MAEKQSKFRNIVSKLKDAFRPQDRSDLRVPPDPYAVSRELEHAGNVNEITSEANLMSQSAADRNTAIQNKFKRQADLRERLIARYGQDYVDRLYGPKSQDIQAHVSQAFDTGSRGAKFGAEGAYKERLLSRLRTEIENDVNQKKAEIDQQRLADEAQRQNELEQENSRNALETGKINQAYQKENQRALYNQTKEYETLQHGARQERDKALKEMILNPETSEIGLSALRRDPDSSLYPYHYNSDGSERTSEQGSDWPHPNPDPDYERQLLSLPGGDILRNSLPSNSPFRENQSRFRPEQSPSVSSLTPDTTPEATFSGPGASAIKTEIPTESPSAKLAKAGFGVSSYYTRGAEPVYEIRNSHNQPIGSWTDKEIAGLSFGNEQLNADRYAAAARNPAYISPPIPQIDRSRLEQEGRDRANPFGMGNQLSNFRKNDFWNRNLGELPPLPEPRISNNELTPNMLDLRHFGIVPANEVSDGEKIDYIPYHNDLLGSRLATLPSDQEDLNRINPNGALTRNPYSRLRRVA